MGKRERQQGEKRPERKEKPTHRILCGVVIPVLLAAALLALGVLAPGSFLNRRAARYGNTTAQAAISDVHPYGDQYETTKASMLTAVQCKEALKNDEIELDIYSNETDEDEFNTQITGRLNQVDDFLNAWAECIGKYGYWIAGLTELSYEDVIAVPSADDTCGAYVVYALDYTSEMETSALVLDAVYGAPVYMELYVTGWDDVQGEMVWASLLDAYQMQFGIQFTDASSEQADEVYMALSVDQALKMEMKLEIDNYKDKGYAIVGIGVEISSVN